MQIDKRNRAELKRYFVKNAIPTESNFAELIDGMLSQRDDGIAKLPNDALSIEAAGDDTSQKKAIHFYGNFRDADPTWVLSLNPRQRPADPATARPGFSISDSAGNSRLFVERGTGKVGIGTVTPRGSLDVPTGDAWVGKVLSISAPADGTNAAVLNLHNETNKKYWHTTLRSGEADKLIFFRNDASNNPWLAVLKLGMDGGVEAAGTVTANRFTSPNTLVLNDYTTVNPASNVYLSSPPNDRDAWIYRDIADTGSNWGIYHRQIDSTVKGLPGNAIGFIGGGSKLQAYIGLGDGTAFFAGNVGFGTQTPQKKLHVQGATAGPFLNDTNDRPAIIVTGHYPHLELFSNVANTNHGPAIRLGAYTDATATSFKHWVIGTAGRNASFLDIGFSDRNDANPHAGIRNHNGKTMVTIKENGTVGIGTLDPASDLHLRRDATGAVGPIITLTNGTGSANTGAAIDFNGYDAGANPATLRLRSLDDGNASSHLAIYTKLPGAVTNALQERMRVSSNGAVSFTGVIIPSHGNSPSNGIRFPSDPGGGGGDTAWIRYYAQTGETTKLLIGVENDPDDTIGFWQSGAERMTIVNGIVRVEKLQLGNKWVMSGVGDPENNDEWLRLFGTEQNGSSNRYYGGFAAGKFWSSTGGFTGSDRELKENIAPLESSLERVCKLQGVQFTWKGVSSGAGREMGFIAQDVEAVFPEVVGIGPVGMKGIDYGRLVAPLIECVKEQQRQIDDLRRELAALKG